MYSCILHVGQVSLYQGVFGNAHSNMLLKCKETKTVRTLKNDWDKKSKKTCHISWIPTRVKPFQFFSKIIRTFLPLLYYFYLSFNPIRKSFSWNVLLKHLISLKWLNRKFIWNRLTLPHILSALKILLALNIIHCIFKLNHIYVPIL